jgi:methyltransferase-like protein/SAM-dependent methyltransferase
MSDANTTSYDEVPYPSYPMAQTHPDWLATLATLFGMCPAPVEHCRVLEIGCASGGNLLPMAEGLPDSEFIGIDLSARHIDTGQATLAALGLTNVRLLRMSIEGVTEELGRFDYVIAHGVYSWVPPPVQDALLAACRKLLTPHGIAFISYNTLPGWHDRGVIRDMMRFHTRHLPEPEAATKQARDLLAFLIESVPDNRPNYRRMLEEEHQRINPCKDSYIFHEHLEELNEPVLFHEFVARAAGHGLQFLAEADRATLSMERQLPRAAVSALTRLTDDIIAREQYLDFLTNRMFRQTLLCRQDIPLRRQLSSESLSSFHVASRARCVSSRPDIQSDKVEKFRGPNKAIASTGHAISKMAFVHLAGIWPQLLPFDDLQVTARARLVGDAVVIQDPEAYARDTRLLAENLFQAFLAGIVELHVHAPCLRREPGERPRARALARWQAQQGTFIANARQEVVNLDPLSCHLLRALDGSRDRAALVESLVDAVQHESLAVERHGRRITEPEYLRAVLARELEPNLLRLARAALLVA